MERNSYNTNLIENEMSKRVYFSPRIDLIPIEQPTLFYLVQVFVAIDFPVLMILRKMEVKQMEPTK